MKYQINSEEYYNLEYLNRKRFNSIYTQLELVSKFKINTLIEIGMGNGILKNLINKLYPNISYSTADFDHNLNPDFSLDLREKHFSKKIPQHDLLLCFQVLEHLEFEYFESSIYEFSKISDNVLLSLPDQKRTYKIFIDLPKIKIKKLIRIGFEKEWNFNGEHYWNLNNKGYDEKKIRNIILKHFNIIEEFNLFENPFHKFYHLKK